MAQTSNTQSNLTERQSKTAASVRFEVTRDDARVIGKIVHRAKGMASDPRRFDGMSMSMDLTACIANGCPLRLDDLLKADGFNFAHDVYGIQKHMNRLTGKLMNCFRPRFAA